MEVAERPSTSVDFEHEVARCEGQMLRLAMGLMGNEPDALDAVQEALIRAYTHLGQFRGDSQFSTWLCRIVHRTCYDELRRRRRRPVPLGDGAPGADPVAPAAGPAPAVPVLAAESPPDPAEVAERREVQRCVRRAVSLLEPPYREVVIRRDLRGQSYVEIARALRVPEGTVKSRLFRARTRLRQEIERVSA
ncbi:RNA polymerase sigma factor [Caldinitratiruptor microaerophilus]|uniref:Sigma-24 n=1 Tax=Caldinitratiruptor microaerophilus TaxID=671077 RepID=A0AA35G912_9FIRM|nr:sigma-70 family RNA polymerase sigma factor [Caldinitratiruptor microaerophilus]BDG61626.1 sigma-24 [Caldinitratiruptor microaerophilus]